MHVQGTGATAKAPLISRVLSPKTFDAWIALPVLSDRSRYRVLRFRLRRGGEAFAGLISAQFVGGSTQVGCHVDSEHSGLHRAYVPASAGTVTLRHKGLVIGRREISANVEPSEALFEFAAPGQVEVVVPPNVDPKRVWLELETAPGASAENSVECVATVCGWCETHTGSMRLRLGRGH